MTTVPDEVKKYIHAFISDDHSLTGMNQQVESNDGNAMYCFEFWVETDETVTASVLVDKDIDETPYENAFDDALTQFGFECEVAFERNETDKDEYRDRFVYSAEYSNPNTSN